MSETITFTDETEFVLSDDVDIKEVHASELAFVLDIETDDEHVSRCEIDLRELVRAMGVYSTKELRHDWR